LIEGSHRCIILALRVPWQREAKSNLAKPAELLGGSDDVF